MNWRDIKGWLSDAEAAALQERADGQYVLEFGCWEGKSAICMAEVAEKVVTVDHFQGDDFAGKKCKVIEAVRNIYGCVMQDRVHLVHMDTETAIDMLDTSQFDFVYYDADHTYDATVNVIRQVPPNLYRTLAIHDYGKFDSVTKAVDAEVKRRGLILTVVDTLAILEQ